MVPFVRPVKAVPLDAAAARYRFSSAMTAKSL
jgi:hypothetical protein